METQIRVRVACVAGVQRGGKGELECERFNNSLPFVRRPRQRSRFALAFNFPPPSPLYVGHAGYVRGTYVPFTFNPLLSLSSVNLTNNSLRFLYRSLQISRGTSYALIYGYFPQGN